MAKKKKKQQKVEVRLVVPEPVEPPPPTVVITLSQEKADILRDFFRRLSMDAKNRKLVICYPEPYPYYNDKTVLDLTDEIHESLDDLFLALEHQDYVP